LRTLFRESLPRRESIDADHTKQNVGIQGIVALQIHRGDELKICFKDIRIKELQPLAA